MSRLTPQRFTHARRATALICLLSSVLLLTTGPGAGKALAKKQTNKLKRGVTLTRVTYPRRPVRLRIITINNPNRHNATVDVGSAVQSFPGSKLTSQIAQSYGAIAAINGDFARSGRPVHLSAEDGELRSTGIAKGVVFSMTADEKRGFAKRPGSLIKGFPQTGSGANFDVEEWNAQGIGGGRLVGYTHVGGSISKPANDSCWARLTPSSQPRWAAQRDGVERLYDVGAQQCEFAAPSIGPENGNVIVQGKQGTSKGETIKGLDGGDEVLLRWSLGWKGVLDALGGAPLLLADPNNNGRATVKAPKHCGSYFCDKNPRTGVGINRGCVMGNDNCKVFYIVVDGRRPGWSVGMDLVQFAKEFKKLGATFAINLDGGGGAEMWVRNRGGWCERRTNGGGCVVNKKTDRDRRAVSALLVLPGSDRQEKLAGQMLTAPLVLGTIVPTAEELASDDAALTDPGSTGGLFDAIASGGLGPMPRPLPPGFEDALARYRAAQWGRGVSPKGSEPGEPHR
jgi:phosphodiester glycosidase